jgi:hypothetical protein
MGELMMRHALTLALLLPTSLLACGSGTGDIPSPGCQSIQLTNAVSFAETPAGDGFATQCLPRAPTLDAATGAASCGAFLGRAASGACECGAGDGLKPVSAARKDAVDQLFGALAPGCVCEIQQLAAAALQACIQQPGSPQDSGGAELSGYCYVDSANPSTNPALVMDCASNEQRALRFVGRTAIHETGDLGIAYLCETDVCPDPAL